MSASPASVALAKMRSTLGVSGQAALTGRGFLRSAYGVSELATESMLMVASAVSELSSRLGFADAHLVEVNRELSDAWYGHHVRPLGWEQPPAWDVLSAAFATADGSWIRTHANVPRHRLALTQALGCEANPGSVAQAIRRWDAEDLEAAIVAHGGAAAALRSASAWSRSGPGRAVAAEPIIERLPGGPWDENTSWSPTPDRPLAGARVLDLTRVIAGPACTQVLAGLGADVLRIDPPDWDEPAVLAMVMWNKRSARLDAKEPAGATRLRELLAQADVVVHGYRAGALDRLGLPDSERARLRPGLIDVSERAYGWHGPWAQRRGFDSLVQFATGIAHTGMALSGSSKPVSLPVQALDWATGYFAAAAVIAGFVRRLDAHTGSTWRLSLARTGQALQDLRASAGPFHTAEQVIPDVPAHTVHTPLGPVALAASPFRVGAATLVYTDVAMRLGNDQPSWR